ncbi:MAG: YtcA family lipoprotein [Terrimicrobiaceae bacterium]
MIIGPMKLTGLLALIKSSGDPLVNVAGAYFPAWLACMLVGVIGTWILHSLAGRFGLAAALRPAPLILPCLFTALTCATWLLFFSA